MTEGQRLARLALFGAAIVPARLLGATPTVCLFRRVTGRPCPSCGLTRSWNSAARLRLRDSLRFHPLGPATFVAALVIAVVPARRLEQPLLRDPRVVAGLAFAWVGAWVGRLLLGGRGD